MKRMKRFIAPVMLGAMLLSFGGAMATTGSVIRLDLPDPELDIETEFNARGSIDEFLNRIGPLF